MIREAIVRERVLGELAKMGFIHQAKRNPGDKGADLKVRHKDRSHYFIVETKGDSNAPSAAAMVHNNVVFALGQLVLRFTTLRGRLYGLGFPETYRRVALGKLTPRLVSLLRLHLFFVSEEGRVDHLTPVQVKRLVRRNA